MTKPTTEQPADVEELTADAIKEAANLPAVPDAQPPALVDTEGDEWADVDDGDLAPDARSGTLTVLRKSSKLDGGFIDEDTGEKTTSLDFVWMAKLKSRALFPKPYKSENRARCRSFNGITADPTSPDLQNGGDCTTCPMAEWHGQDAPECSEAVEALAFLPPGDGHGVGRLARIRFNGLGVGPARAYWRSFSERLPKRPPISVVTHVELEQATTPNGTFLKPRFTRRSELTRAQVQPLLDERDRRIEEWKAAIAVDVAERTQDADEANHVRHTPPGDEEEPF